LEYEDELDLEEDEELQRKVAGLAPAAGGADVGPDLESSIHRARSGGQPLSDGVRQPMERAFGADFGRVRVHNDGEADRLNRSIQGRAFTTGQDIFLRQGEFRPGSSEGQRLLAHELTHVVQQEYGHGKPTIQMRYMVSANDDEEQMREAAVMGAKVLGSSAQLQGASEGLLQDQLASMQLMGLEQVELQTKESSTSSTQSDPANVSYRLSAQAGRTVQRFTNIVLAGRHVRNFSPPTGSEYNFFNSQLKSLKDKLDDYRKFEANPEMVMVLYRPEASQIPTMEQAVNKLQVIEATASKVKRYLNNVSDYNSIMSDLDDVIATARLDRIDYSAMLQEACNETVTASDAAWYLWNNPYVLPTSEQLALAYNRARSAGILQVLPGKWWSSNTFPGPNAEMYVSINNILWSIVHVKWHNIYPITFENVEMANFKAPNGSTIPNSIITNDAAKRSLLGEALHYGTSAPLPRSKDKNMT